MATRPLVDQPNSTPTRKVTGAGAGGLVAVVAIAILSGLGIDVPGVDFDALPVTEAITGLAAFGAAYYTRERR